MDTKKIEAVINNFYKAVYSNNRQAFYGMLANSFKDRVSLEEFNRYRQYRMIDIGRLEKVEKIQEDVDKILVTCKIKIRENTVTHVYHLIEERGEYYLIPDSFMFAK
ncbi:hypothetical protein [Facklamia miroungae]|uniref:Uncharacterized protein n=1 Tax=Facklamia miroungae TaxID=120956 RepID=A0A1G7SR42_9LACT|nr:hypothetical protein [Facklamia miroungae]NKZ29568.1 hypothetical protein [Facklamia miroungae]SDG25503.1 hypothetical protein SAMN05421791_104124 [Facklamia miroungae]